MNGFLLDTNICVFLFRNKWNIADRLNHVGFEKCFISEITFAELKYGAYKSNRTKENLQLIDSFLQKVNVVPFEVGIDIFAQTKNSLRLEGFTIEDFDLLIAASALAWNLTLVTDNIKHFRYIPNLEVINWVDR